MGKLEEPGTERVFLTERHYFQGECSNVWVSWAYSALPR